MGAMSVGEATGPILGGWLVGVLGFRLATAVFAVAAVPLAVAALLAHDPDVIARRQRNESNVDESAETEPTSPLLSVPGSPFSRRRTGAPNTVRGALGLCDGDSAYVWRRLPFALVETRALNERRCESAPSAGWRRQYKVEPGIMDHSRTAPSAGWRRAYEGPRASSKE